MAAIQRYFNQSNQPTLPPSGQGGVSITPTVTPIARRNSPYAIPRFFNENNPPPKLEEIKAPEPQVVSQPKQEDKGFLSSVFQKGKAIATGAIKEVQSLDFERIKTGFTSAVKATPGTLKIAGGVILDSLVQQQKLMDNFFNKGEIFGKKVPEPVRAALAQPQFQIQGALMRPIIPKAEEAAKKIREEGEVERKKAVEPYAKLGAAKGGLQTITEAIVFNVPQMALSTGLTIATAFATKNPYAAGVVGLSTSYGLGASEVYTEARENGLSDKEAMPLSQVGGMIIGALDFLPLERLIRKTGAAEPVKKSIIKKIASGLVSVGMQSGYEGITEGAQEIVGNAVESTYKENVDLLEGVDIATIVGAVFGGVADVSVSGVNLLTGKKQSTSEVIENVNQKLEDALSTPASKRTDTQKKLVDMILTQEFTPEEAGGLVLKNELETTDLGKEIMKATVQANQEGKNIKLVTNQETGDISVELVDKTAIPEVIRQEIKTQETAITEGEKTKALEFVKEPTEGYISELEEKSLTVLKEDPVKMRNDYLSREDVGGNEINPDKMRLMFEEHGYTGANANEFNRAVNALTDITYNHLIETKQGLGNNTAVFTAGSSGSGKSFFVASLADKSSYPIILDTTFSYNSAIKRVKQALDNGFNAQISYMFREPLDAWVNGVLPRVKATGRVIDEAYHLDSLDKARENILKAYDKYKGNEKVEFRFTKNATGKDPVEISIENVRDFSYNRQEVAEQMKAATDKAYEQKQLTKEQYEAITSSREALAKGAEEGLVQPHARKHEPEHPQRPTPRRVLKPTGKVTEEKLHKALNLKAARQLPVMEAVPVRDGRMYFSNLEVEVIIPTDRENGLYRAVGSDFLKTELNMGEAPEPVKQGDKAVGAILAENLVDVFSKAKAYLDKSAYSPRPLLQGVHFEFENGNLTVTATDGFRLYHHRVPLKSEATESFTIFPAEIINQVIGILQGKTEIKVGKENITFTDGERTVTARRLEGEFPNYKNVFPSLERQISVDKKSFQDAIKTLTPYAKKGANQIKLSLKENKLVLTASEPEGATKTVELNASVKDISIPAKSLMDGTLLMPIRQEEETDSASFNYNYLNDALKTLDEKPAVMRLHTTEDGKLTTSPMHISDREEEFVAPKVEKASKEAYTPQQLNTKVDLPGRPDTTIADLFDLYSSLTKENVDALLAGNKTEITWLSKKTNEEQTVVIEPLPSSKETGGKYASKGLFAEDLENLTNSMGYFRVIEFPEMVRLAKELTGQTPEVKKLRAGTRGMAYPKSMKIKLDPKIFKDPLQAAKTLAHELGHITDFLPDQVTARGNIVGRIATLKKHLKQKYGNLDNKVIKQELWDLSRKWRPFDEEGASSSVLKYRKSPEELYADAVSVLFNDPERLKLEAPNFWNGFFEYLNRKPEVHENFFATWDLLTKGEEVVLSEREKSIRQMFNKGEDLFAVKRAELGQEQKSLRFRLYYDLVDKNAAVIEQVKTAKKKNISISDEDNPLHWLEGHDYVGGKIKVFLEKNLQPVYKEIMDNGLTWEDLGEVMLLERAMYERGEMANPLGFNPETAQKQIDYLKSQLGDRYKVLERVLPKFRTAIKSVIDPAAESGLWSEDLVSELKANPAYATFQVLDYLDLNLPSSIKKQIGTLKEVSNPATASIIKTISILRAIERNNVKRKIVQFPEKYLGEKVTPAKTKWNGRFHEPIESREPNEALFTVMEDGKLKGYYVDPYIAKTMEYMGTSQANAVIETLRFFNSKLFRPLFITYNPGFQTFNFVRDMMRFYKNTPHMPLWRVFYRYSQALPSAVKRAWNVNDRLIQEMEEAQILSITYNDLSRGQSDVDSQIEAIMKKYDVLPKAKGKANLFTKVLKSPLDFIENVGNAIETLPKVAGYIELNGKMPPMEMATFIRNNVGSPNFLRRSGSHAWINETFLFYNAIKEGVRSDFNVAFKDPQTRAGWWWKTAWITALPKIIMFSALMGFFGEKMKDMMEDVSEYTKSNYIVIPLGKEGNKTVALTIPQDETGRILGGLIWKTLRLGTYKDLKFSDVTDILAYAGGQAPSITPSIETVAAITQYAAGQNPYDLFRGRNILSDQEFEAGQWSSYSLKPFAMWLFQQMGGSIVLGSSIIEKTPSSVDGFAHKLVSVPVVSNIIGRWIRISNYGKTESTKRIQKQIQQDKAREQLETRQILNDAIKQYNSGAKTTERRTEIERDLVNNVVGKIKDSNDKRKRTNLIKKFRLGVIRGESDPLTNALIDADTNDEKAVILTEAKLTLGDKYEEFERKMRKEGVISDDVVKKVKKSLR